MPVTAKLGGKPDKQHGAAPTKSPTEAPKCSTQISIPRLPPWPCDSLIVPDYRSFQNSNVLVSGIGQRHKDPVPTSHQSSYQSVDAVQKTRNSVVSGTCSPQDTLINATGLPTSASQQSYYDEPESLYGASRGFPLDDNGRAQLFVSGDQFHASPPITECPVGQSEAYERNQTITRGAYLRPDSANATHTFCGVPNEAKTELLNITSSSESPSLAVGTVFSQDTATALSPGWRSSSETFSTSDSYRWVDDLKYASSVASPSLLDSNASTPASLLGYAGSDVERSVHVSSDSARSRSTTIKAPRHEKQRLDKANLAIDSKNGSQPKSRREKISRWQCFHCRDKGVQKTRASAEKLLGHFLRDHVQQDFPNHNERLYACGHCCELVTKLTCDNNGKKTWDSLWGHIILHYYAGEDIEGTWSISRQIDALVHQPLMLQFWQDLHGEGVKDPCWIYNEQTWLLKSELELIHTKVRNLRDGPDGGTPETQAKIDSELYSLVKRVSDALESQKSSGEARKQSISGYLSQTGLQGELVVDGQSHSKYEIQQGINRAESSMYSWQNSAEDVLMPLYGSYWREPVQSVLPESSLNVCQSGNDLVESETSWVQHASMAPPPRLPSSRNFYDGDMANTITDTFGQAPRPRTMTLHPSEPVYDYLKADYLKFRDGYSQPPMSFVNGVSYSSLKDVTDLHAQSQRNSIAHPLAAPPPVSYGYMNTDIPQPNFSKPLFYHAHLQQPIPLENSRDRPKLDNPGEAQNLRSKNSLLSLASQASSLAELSSVPLIQPQHLNYARRRKPSSELPEGQQRQSHDPRMLSGSGTHWSYGKSAHQGKL